MIIKYLLSRVFIIILLGYVELVRFITREENIQFLYVAGIVLFCFVLGYALYRFGCRFFEKTRLRQTPPKQKTVDDTSIQTRLK